MKILWFSINRKKDNIRLLKGTQVNESSLVSLFFSTFFDIEKVCIKNIVLVPRLRQSE